MQGESVCFIFDESNVLSPAFLERWVLGDPSRTLTRTKGHGSLVFYSWFVLGMDVHDRNLIFGQAEMEYDNESGTEN